MVIKTLHEGSFFGESGGPVFVFFSAGAPKGRICVETADFLDWVTPNGLKQMDFTMLYFLCCKLEPAFLGPFAWGCEMFFSTFPDPLLRPVDGLQTRNL